MHVLHAITLVNSNMSKGYVDIRLLTEKKGFDLFSVLSLFSFIIYRCNCTNRYTLNHLITSNSLCQKERKLFLSVKIMYIKAITCAILNHPSKYCCEFSESKPIHFYMYVN